MAIKQSMVSQGGEIISAATYVTVLNNRPKLEKFQFCRREVLDSLRVNGVSILLSVSTHDV